MGSYRVSLQHRFRFFSLYCRSNHFHFASSFNKISFSFGSYLLCMQHQCYYDYAGFPSKRIKTNRFDLIPIIFSYLHFFLTFEHFWYHSVVFWFSFLLYDSNFPFFRLPRLEYCLFFFHEQLITLSICTVFSVILFLMIDFSFLEEIVVLWIKSFWLLSCWIKALDEWCLIGNQ